MDSENERATPQGDAGPQYEATGAGRTPRVRMGLAPGDSFGKYEIGKQIGAGGMSVVWKGYDRLLDRHVAIKQLLPDVIDVGDQMHERFRAEAEIQKKVSHAGSHVVRVFDLVDEPRGMFIVMEYVPGQSLEQRLTESPEPMPEREALGIVGTAAMALAAIHKHDIVHRDLKPSNILLTSSGGLKLCDFGLAALLGDQESLSIGSVRYMAPELFRDEPVDARSDIYSLGMIAYELLAGRRQFAEAFKIVLRDTRNQTLRWMKWHTNPRATVSPLAKLNPGISQKLDELVARMMAKDPDQRISSADELISAIRRHFAGAVMGTGDIGVVSAGAAAGEEANEPAPAGQAISPDTPTAALPRRSRWPHWLAAILALQLVVVGGLWTWSAQQKETERAQEAANAMAKYVRGVDFYENGRYILAQPLFEQLTEEWEAGSVLGMRARAFAELTTAQRHMLEGRYGSAKNRFAAVKEMDVLKTRRQHIEVQLDLALRCMSFAQAVGGIELAIKNDQLSQAIQLLNELDDSFDSKTAEEGKKLGELETQIKDLLDRRRIDTALAEAEALAASGKPEEAKRLLELAQFKYRSDLIKSAIEQLQKDMSYDLHLAQATEAERADKLDEAIQALKAAAQIKPSEALHQKAMALHGRKAYQDARQAEEAGDMVAAKAAYKRAADYGLTEGRQALARIEVADTKAAFVRAADQAMSAGDWETAIEQYQNAQPLPSQAARSLTIARVRLKLRQGRQLLDQGKTIEARQAFAVALELAPDDKAAGQGLLAVNKRIKYLRLLAEGDSLRAAGKLGPAKRKYMDARDTIRTDEVQKRLADTEYDDMLVKARQYINARDWKAAASWVQAAANVHDSEKVQELMKIIEQNREE